MWRRAAAGVVAGLAWGIADRLLANASEAGLDASNVSSLWLALAFAAGALAPSLGRAAVLGVLTLLAVDAGYYGWMHFAEGQVNAYYLLHVAAPWFVAAVAGGPVFGALGLLYARGRRWAGLCLAAAFLLEPLTVFTRGAPAVRIGEIALGCVLGAGLFVARSPRSPEAAT